MVAIVVAGLGASSLPAVAAPGDGTLSVDLTQTTGTGPFDADDAAGHDSSGTNDIVRTNDTVTYRAGIRYEGEDQTTPTIAFTLPQGQELVSLPPFCLAGSSVTPASLGDPGLPLTATSYQGLATQQVSCVVANQAEGTALNYDFIANLRPEVPNGTTMGPVKVTATSDQVTTPVESTTVSQTVSAAPRFDLSKRATGATDNTGPLFQQTQACSFDAARACQYILFPVTFTAPQGAKGLSPLMSTAADPITFTDDLDPNTFYGPGTTGLSAWTAAGAGAIDKYGARIAGCSLPNQSTGQLPGTEATAGYTTGNSVRDSGTITCTQPGGPGTQVFYSIVGADTTAYTVPSTTGNGTALPVDLSYVISTSMAIEVPTDAIKDLGTADPSGTSWALDWRNTFTDVEAVDIAGQPNVDPPANNTRIGTSRYELAGTYTKGFTGVAGSANNAAACGFSACAYEGPPGSSTYRDGNTVVVPGQRVVSNLLRTFQIPPGSGTLFDRSVVLCDVWDASKLALAAGNYPGGSAQRQKMGSAGAPVWVSYFGAHGINHTDVSGLANYKVQYSTGPEGSGADSECGSGTWYDDPADVPGAVQDSDGSYSVVNRVRVAFSTESDASFPGFDVNVAIGMEVLPGTVGTILPNWASRKEASGTTDMDGVLADSGEWADSTYNPTTVAGGAGDRLILGAVTSRITKFVRTGGGTFDSSAEPHYTAGSQVDYRLNPSLTADVTAGTTDQVFVEDCLPKYQQFVSSTRETSGDPIVPVLVQAGAPAGSELTCGLDETYIKWDLGLHEVNTVIDPIVYSVEILDTVRNATYVNTTLVSSPGDPSAAALRDDTAAIQVVTPTGIKIAKSTPQSVVEVNPAGIASPRQLHWTVDFANIDAQQNVSDVDVIDVLPAEGLGDSDFTGTLAFDSATVAAGTGIDILYSSVAPADLEVDADDPSNATGGSTVWCDAASGGAVVLGSGSAADCPTSAAAVTGLRFLRPGAFDPTDNFSIDITMTPSGNAGGDVYDNITSGRADGVSQAVGPASRAIQIIESSIGNYVWLDDDRDGVQDAGEDGIAGFTVKLSGTDLDGNTISASTTTDADGHYLFAGLPSGTYEVTFDPASLKAWQAFTAQDAGGDDAEDSDGDLTTGKVTGVVLDPDTQLLSVDQGVVVDKGRPGYVTTISDQATTVGDKVTDQVVVSGLFAGEPVQMHWQLYGPYAAKADMTCQPAAVFAEGDLTVTGNGTVTTPEVILTKAGYYTYVQSSAATAAYDAQRTDCGIDAETTLVTEQIAPPLPPTKSTVRVTTVSSHQTLTLPLTGGVKVSDKVTINGLPDGVDAKVTGALYGPFATEKAIRCNPANAFRTVGFTAHGKGVYRTSKVKVTEPGWYSWAMKVPSTPLSRPATEGCGKAQETLLATRVQAPVPPVPTGFTGSDATDGTDDLDFFEEVAAIIDRADGVEDGNIPAGTPGDLPVVTEEEAAQLAAQGAAGASVPEVALAPTHSKRLFSPKAGLGVRRQAGTTVKIPAVGISTSVDRSDIARGVLAVPSNVSRVGWFGRSAHVDDVIGASVIAGHVSDEHDRPGAFYRLRNVQRGDIVTVVQNGRTHRFKVTSLKTYDRARQLPAGAFATSGQHRLSLITCTGKVTYPNGRFHYTKNLIVTAQEIR